MNRILIIFAWLLLRVNGSAFLPAFTAEDTHARTLAANTLVTYACDVAGTRHDDDDPACERNHNARPVNLVKTIDYYVENDHAIARRRPLMAGAKRQFCSFSAEKIYPVALDILAPPPKA